MRQRHSCYVQRMLQSELDTSKTKFKKHEKNKNLLDIKSQIPSLQFFKKVMYYLNSFLG